VQVFSKKEYFMNGKKTYSKMRMEKISNKNLIIIVQEHACRFKANFNEC
jgi:hypothetical protein